MKTGRQIGYVQLFGSNKKFVQCKLISDKNLPAVGDADTSLLGILIAAVIPNYAVTTKPIAAVAEAILSGSDLGIQSKLARVSVKKSKELLHDKVSRFTKQTYKAKESNSASSAIGALIGGTDTTITYNAAVAALKAVFKPAGTDTSSISISFRPQGNISLD
jgi:hypothetical protein